MASSIVRLKGLDVNAGADDIRAFFRRFHIPGGAGVYILGGERREAFIAFSCLKDARRAIHYSRRPLKGSKVEIRRSTITELENKLKYFLKKRKSVSEPTKTLESALAPSGGCQCSPEMLPVPGYESNNSSVTSHSVPSGFLQSSRKSKDPRTTHFFTSDCPQPHFVNPGNESTNSFVTSHSVPSGFLQISRKSNDPRTTHFFTSDCPQPHFADPGNESTNSSVTSSGFLQISSKSKDPRTTHFVTSASPQPHDPRVSPPFETTQMCDKSLKTDSKSVLPCVTSECLKTPCDLHTLRTSPHFVASSSPQMGDELHEPRCLKTLEGSHPHQPSVSLLDTSECPQLYNQIPSSESIHNAFVLGVCTALHLQSCRPNEAQEVLPGLDWLDANNTRAPEQMAKIPPPGYVRLLGLPDSITKEDINDFFKGLKVQEMVANVKFEHRRLCLVKFGDEDDALAALQFNNRFMGSICVEVRNATELMWTTALQECENQDVRCSKSKQRYLTDPKNYKPKLSFETQNRLPVPHISKKSRLSMPTKEYIVMVCNIPVTTTKTELRELLGYPDMQSSKIQHLLAKDFSRTDTAFLIFDRKEDYEHAMTQNGVYIYSKCIELSAITRERMNDIMGKKHHTGPQYGAKISPSKYGAKISASKYGAKISASKYGAKISPPKYGAKISPPKYDAKISPPKYDAKISPPKYDIKISPSKYDAKISPSKYDAKISPSKYDAKISPSKYDAKISPSKYDAKISPSKYGAKTSPSAEKGGSKILENLDLKYAC
ncbi:RNA binding motif protein 12Ba [Entelurus aequoreus]|uniref:RNA binding motif protein 12Ba n=1 Tax=Entelurus aequoreus TaxID=161455 RepID=UPI002B1E4A06|nr:RNA binding motif protein 12Ba [Entelurus aequoreus]